MYNLVVRPFVKKMDLEKASKIALRYFRIQGKIPGERFLSRHIFHKNRPAGLEREVFGLKFYNPLGLGPGLDRSGVLYNDLNDLGFSFTEIGPFDEKTIRKAIDNVQNDPPNDILAAEIQDDFLHSFTLAYDFFDFFVFDISDSHTTDDIDSLLDTRLTYDSYKPILIKVPEVMTEGDLTDMADYCLMNGVDGIVARTIAQIELLHIYTQGKLPIVANCHIITPQEAAEALEAGASLLEIRSGLVRKGPKIIDKILRHLLATQSK